MSIKDRHIKLTLSVSIYSFDDSNGKVNIANLQKRQYCDQPQIKNLMLVIPTHDAYMGSDRLFIVHFLYLATILKGLNVPSQF